MSTVLITYSTPPLLPTPPEPRPGSGALSAGASVGIVGSGASGASGASGPTDADAHSVAWTTSGVDEAIAAVISDELSRSGHRITCRPCVAITTTDGFDLVVAVDRLQVSHSIGSPTVLVHPAEPRPDPEPFTLTTQTIRASQATPWQAGQSALETHPSPSSIPMTWAADWRAVDAWARSVGDHLVHFLELRTELARVRAELDRCRAMLRAATPEPRPVSAVELGRPVGHDTARGGRRAQRIAPVGRQQRG